MIFSMVRRRKFMPVLAAAAMAGLSSRAGATTLFDSTSQTGVGFLSGSSITHYAETITLNGSSTQSYTINYLPRFAINWSNISAGSQVLFLDFYTGVNLSSASTNAFSNATFIGYVGFGLPAPTTAGGYFYALGSTTNPFTNQAASTTEPLIVPGNTFTVVATMENTGQTAYSNAINGFLSTGTPAVGSDPGFVWIDSNQDGTFVGGEQYQNSAGSTAIAMSVDATAVVPVNYNWNSSTGGNWEDSTKWTPNGVPTISDNALFNLSSNPVTAPGYTVAVNSAADLCNNLTVQSDRVTLGLSATSGAALTVNSTLTVGAPAATGTSTVFGFLNLTSSGSGAPVNVSTGSVVVGATGGVGKLIIGSNVQLINTNGVTLGPGSSLVIQDNAVLATFTLTLAGTTDNWTSAVDITSGATVLPGGSLATVTNQVKQGFNLTGGANWNGSGGITSSTAASDVAHLTAVGVIKNNQGGTAIYGNGTTLPAFGLFSPSAGAILIKYTYFGDANLDGIVDGSDYSLIDAGYATNQPGFVGTVLSGWYNGDFNYDGVIDGSDYALIDNAFNNQGSENVSQLGPLLRPAVGGTTGRAVSDLPTTYTPIDSSVALVASTSADVAPAAVPEPAAISLAIAAIAFGATRRRRNI